MFHNIAGEAFDRVSRADMPGSVSRSRSAVTDDRDPLPAAILVQFDRMSGRYEVTFEDADPTRWQVTPANIGSVGEQLRPAFDGEPTKADLAP